MRWSPKIASVAGIPVRVHWTFAGLVLLLVAGTAGSGAAAVFDALAWLALLFGSVVAHEVTHCFEARRRGLPVLDIVLLPIGGVSEIESIDRSAADEWRVALVGPLTSLVLAGALLGTAAAAGRLPWPPGIDSLSTGPWVAQAGWINLTLGVFNLLPAMPMDGGRVLRAALRPRMGLRRATELTTRVAIGIGAVLVVAGVLVDLWLAIIGVFLMLAARSEGLAVEMQAALAGRQVGDLTVVGVAVLPPEATVAEARWANQAHPWLVVVVAEPEGDGATVTPERLDEAQGSTPLSQVAERHLPMLKRTDPLWPTAVTAFARSRSGQLPVADDGHPVGIIDRRDVEWLLDRQAGGRRR